MTEEEEKQASLADSLAADEVNGAAHVHVHKADVKVLLNQLGSPGHGIREATTDLQPSMPALCLG